MLSHIEKQIERNIRIIINYWTASGDNVIMM